MALEPPTPIYAAGGFEQHKTCSDSGQGSEGKLSSLGKSLNAAPTGHGSNFAILHIILWLLNKPDRNRSVNLWENFFPAAFSVFSFSLVQRTGLVFRWQRKASISRFIAPYLKDALERREQITSLTQENLEAINHRATRRFYTTE